MISFLSLVHYPEQCFNSVNRPAALHNILRICPSLAQILINTYQRPVRLIIPGSGGLMSTEGTTQGDPLAMAMYALAVTPLIHHLRSSDPAVSQVWYADDATGVRGKCAALRKWWDTLSQLGPLFGYIPNTSKTYLVVKDKYVAAARHVFSGTGVVISADGQDIWVLRLVIEIILLLMSLLRFRLGAMM